jgi:hypothetical protein
LKRPAGGGSRGAGGCNRPGVGGSGGALASVDDWKKKIKQHKHKKNANNFIFLSISNFIQMQ